MGLWSIVKEFFSKKNNQPVVETKVEEPIIDVIEVSPLVKDESLEKKEDKVEEKTEVVVDVVKTEEKLKMIHDISPVPLSVVEEKKVEKKPKKKKSTKKSSPKDK